MVVGGPCHELRHTCLPRLREAGMALEAIRAQAGHRSIESTRVYLHLTNDWLAGEYQRAAGRIDAAAVAELVAAQEMARGAPDRCQNPPGRSLPPGPNGLRSPPGHRPWRRRWAATWARSPRSWLPRAWTPPTSRCASSPVTSSTTNPTSTPSPRSTGMWPR